MKQVLLILTGLVLLINLVNAQKEEVFSIDGKAIRGHDPVSFFKEGKPVKGKDSLGYEWKGTTWLFATKANLDSFRANPGIYEPQYGGYCAFGTADGTGHKAPTDIDTWTIKDGKLYFNYNKKVKEFWMKDQDAMIKKADENWPSVSKQ